jgi:hypothetical protein
MTNLEPGSRGQSVDLPLDVEERSMRVTASRATGKISWAGLPPRICPAMPANSKSLRHAWARQVTH